MTEITQSTYCSNGHPLSELPSVLPADRQPCPECGSMGRSFGLGVAEPVSVKEHMKAVAKHDGIKSPSIAKVYDDFNYDHQKPVTVTQVVNEVEKTYAKSVVGKDGHVIKDVKGPLGQQSLHGKQESPKDN